MFLKHFRDNRTLRLHASTVHSDRNVKQKCNECPKSFTQKSGLKIHINTVHKGLKLYKCDMCEKSFAQTGGLIEHIRVNHEASGFKPFACDKCDVRCSRKRSLDLHISRMHADFKQYFCEICQKGIFGRKEMILHQTSKEHLENSKTINFANKKHGCFLCKTIFPDEEKLKKHLLQDEKVKILKCETCGDVFYNLNSFKHHMNTVHLRKRFGCNQCDRSYSVLKDLNLHIKGKHENDARLQCKICLQRFSKFSSVKDHMKGVHAKDLVKLDVKNNKKDVHQKDFVKVICDICSKTYRDKKSLDRHYDVVHKALKNYKCQKCNKSYGRPENLAEHVRITHESNGIKPFACEICQFRCSRKSRLKMHIANIHGGIRERKYHCDICDMGFFEIKGYQQHQKCKGHLKKMENKDTVTSEKDHQNFKCLFCKTVYGNQEKLREHLHQEGCRLMKEKIFNENRQN